MSLIIGVTGFAGAGKDTVGGILQANYGFKRLALADPIKDMLSVIGVDCHTRKTKDEYNPRFYTSPRRLMQTLGTEWAREMIHPDFWISILKDKMKEAVARDYVITDIRMPNEAAWIRSVGQLWFVKRDSATAATHATEHGLASQRGDVILDNNGSFEDLTARVNFAYRALENAKA